MRPNNQPCSRLSKWYRNAADRVNERIRTCFACSFLYKNRPFRVCDSSIRFALDQDIDDDVYIEPLSEDGFWPDYNDLDKLTRP